MGRKARNPDTGIAMDMTPMIDVTFQLIIFFMLITDMTTQDLEVLVLPPAETASPDKPDPKEVRPVINILSDGQILVKRELLYDPKQDDQYQKVKQYLADMAKRMPKKPLVEGDASSRKIPDNPVLVRADQATPFVHIQKVMELCGLADIQIWKIQLAAAEGKKPDEGAANPQ